MSEGFAEASNLAGTLSGWALLVIGASVLMVVRTSYYRPKSIGIRLLYLLLFPGWGLLAASMYFGMAVQRGYIDLVFTNPHGTELASATQAMFGAAQAQITTLVFGVGILSVWLFGFLIWWIVSREAPGR